MTKLAQHSSTKVEHYTPDIIVKKARIVLGTIDFDPASDAFGNSRIRAKIYLSEHSLESEWPAGSIFLNPPGGKEVRNQAILFWQKLMEHFASGKLTHAIFIAFSLQHLQTSQVCPVSMMEFPICVPAKRLKFLDASGIEQTRPTHSNAIVYVPGTVDRTPLFIKTFKDLGVTK